MQCLNQWSFILKVEPSLFPLNIMDVRLYGATSFFLSNFLERMLFSKSARASVKTSGIWLFLEPYKVPLMEPFYDPHLQPSSTQKERQGVCMCVCVCFPTLRATVITHQSLCSEASQLEEQLECGALCNRNKHTSSIEIKFLYE